MIESISIKRNEGLKKEICKYSYPMEYRIERNPV